MTQQQNKQTLTRIMLQMPADTLTPTAALLRLRQRPEQALFLFESAGSDLEQARYSFLGLNPCATLTLHKGLLTLLRAGHTETLEGPPLDTLREYLQADFIQPDSELPPFCGGYVGYLGYDIVNYLEQIPLQAQSSDLPEACLMRFEQLLVFDHLKRKIFLIAHLALDADPQAHQLAREQLQAIQHQLSQPSPDETLLLLPKLEHIIEIQGQLGESAFAERVQKLKQAIYEGEIFQAVLAEQFQADYLGDPFLLYRVLCSLNPSPYLFYLSTGQAVLLGASPELLLKSDGSQIATCPIAGTRRRGRNRMDDQRLAKELLADEKERAEHLMLVDLGRNDLGRVAQAGTVQVSRYMEIEYFSHVMHLVSLVEAELAAGKTAWDALLACFPAGTLSGAPKIRAMQLLAELEPVRRGWYGGAVFYSGFDGQLDACITIRSLAYQQGRVTLQAGAGIVADSQPELEYKEVRNKARVMFQTLQLAKMVSDSHSALQEQQP